MSLFVRSLNVGLPREVAWGDRVVRTGIFKDPTVSPVAVTREGLRGDGQADTKVHGGWDKAVYAYSTEAYGEWREDLTKAGLSWGAFGENLTLDGLEESRIHLGDLFEVGACHLRATQPRIPCFKLGIRFGDASIVERFLRAGRPGVYFAVEREGELRAGDSLRLLERGDGAVPVLEIYEIFRDRGTGIDRAREILRSRHLIPSWKAKLENFVTRTSA